MAQKYKTILTKLGKEKMASLIAGEKLELTHLAVGDGELEPNEEQTSLQNEKYRGDVQKVEISSTKGNRVNILGIIPKDVGGFWIREVGVFDSDGDLIAIGNVGETYKSLASDGSDKELGYNVIIEVDNIDNIELEIDESILYATKKELEYYNKIDSISYIGDGQKYRLIEMPKGTKLVSINHALQASQNYSAMITYGTLVNHQFRIITAARTGEVLPIPSGLGFGSSGNLQVVSDDGGFNELGVEYYISVYK